MPTKLTLAEARILWWIVRRGDYPSHVDGHGWGWVSRAISYLNTCGVSNPTIPEAAMSRLFERGFLAWEDLTVPLNVAIFPHRKWGDRIKHAVAVHNQQGSGSLEWNRRPALLVTDAGRAAAPVTPPYPWVPSMNRRSDVVRDEAQRLQNALHAMEISAGLERRDRLRLGRRAA